MARERRAPSAQALHAALVQAERVRRQAAVGLRVIDLQEIMLWSQALASAPVPPDLSVDKSGRACLPPGRRVTAPAQADAA